MNRTPIEWTDFSANPLKFRGQDGKVGWGCVHASPGCVNCYAETLAKRYGRGGPFNVQTMAGLTPFLDDGQLHKMLTAQVIEKTPVSGGKCFVGDMTDIFGEWVSDDLLDELFAVMALRGAVTWQLLTKRARRMQAYFYSSGRFGRIVAAAIRFASRHDSRPEGGCLQTAFELEELMNRGKYWPLPNVWLGVSCEDQQRADERIPHLLKTPAAVRFISAEPLLGPIHLKQQNPDGFWPPNAPQPDVAWLRHKDWPDDFQYWTTGLDWVIVGGESGGGARNCEVSWVRSIVGQCRAGLVPVFVKQLGGRVIDRNDAGFMGEDDTAWPDSIDQDDRIEHDLDGTRDGYQGAPVRIHLNSRKGSDMAEWPEDLRVREFPRSAASA